MLIFMILTSQVEGSQEKLAAGDILLTIKMNAAWYPFCMFISYFPRLDKVVKYNNFSLQIASLRIYNFIFPPRDSALWAILSVVF